MTGSAPTPDSSTLLGVEPQVLLPIVAILLGLSLWAFGRRLLKPLLGMTGLLVGAVGGWALGSTIMDADIVPLPIWMMALISGLTLACFAALGHRLVVTGILMGVGGLAGLGLIWTFAGLSFVPPGDDAAEVEAIEARPFALPEVQLDLSETLGMEIPAGFEDRWRDNLGDLMVDMGIPEELDPAGRVDEARGATSDGLRWIEASWAEAPQRVRTTAVAATLMGLLLGLLFATVAPNTATSLVTASLGSGMWMAGGAVMLTAWNGGMTSWLPTGPTAWFACWALFTVIGLAIQWTRRPRKADKAG